MVILVIGGYQWLSVVISGVVENNFLHFKTVTIVTIYGWRQSSPGCRASPSTKHCRFCSSSLQRSFFSFVFLDDQPISASSVIK